MSDSIRDEERREEDRWSRLSYTNKQDELGLPVPGRDDEMPGHDCLKPCSVCDNYKRAQDDLYEKMFGKTAQKEGRP